MSEIKTGDWVQLIKGSRKGKIGRVTYIEVKEVPHLFLVDFGEFSQAYARETLKKFNW